MGLPDHTAILFLIFWGSTMLFSSSAALTWKAHSYSCSISVVSHIKETYFSPVCEVSCFCLNPFIILMLAGILVHRKFEQSALQKLYIILLGKYEASFQSSCVNYRYGFNYMAYWGFWLPWLQILQIFCFLPVVSEVSSCIHLSGPASSLLKSLSASFWT